MFINRPASLEVSFQSEENKDVLCPLGNESFIPSSFLVSYRSLGAKRNPTTATFSVTGISSIVILVSVRKQLIGICHAEERSSRLCCSGSARSDNAT